MSTATERAKRIFRRRGGTLRASEALREGIHPRTLYAMRDQGVIETLARGLYRLAELAPMGNPDLAMVAKRAPNGVICLISALTFHEITTQIPHEVHVALPRDVRAPRIEYPPVRLYRFGGEAYTEGVETHTLDGVDVRVYGVEKTIADCFKYRNKIGLDVATEALRLYRERRRLRVDEMLRYARICRVARVIRPYLEMTV